MWRGGWCTSLGGLTNGLVKEEGLADIFDLGDCAFEVEGLGKDDFEDLGLVLVRSFWPYGMRKEGEEV